MQHFYPIFLKLKNKNCLIVGGGKVAQRKIETLLDYDGTINVVSPHVENKIRLWAEQGRISLSERFFRPEDLNGMFMVFIATDDIGMNAQIADLCKEKGIMVNAVDDPANCDFYVPSILRRDSLCLAISTEGKSPAFARWFKKQMENYISKEYGEFLELLGEIRPEIRNLPLSAQEKSILMEEIIASDWLKLLAAGDEKRLKEQIRECLSSRGTK